MFSNNYTSRYRVYHSLLYGWVIFNTISMLPGYSSLWANEFIPSKDLTDALWIEKAINLLHYDDMANLSPLFIALQLAFCIATLRGFQPMISASLVWFLTVNLDNKVHVTMDGGNNLIHLLLFYSIFFSDIKNRIPLIRNLGIVFYHVSRCQLCIVYIVAGLVKVTGDHWVSGMGIYYTFTVDEYTVPVLQELVMKFPIISVIGSYTTLLFQLTFPYLIWVKPVRKYYFLLGSIIHLGISFGMGLVSFGLAMVVAYALFYTEEQANEIIIYLRRFRDVIKKPLYVN